jgi:hypothetical protein
MHGIQAEVLLSLYFFRAGRFLEGKYHCSAAVSMIMGTRMHKIRSMHDLQMPPYTSLGETISLPHPADAIEEGERIIGFWTVYALHNCWSSALGSPMPLPFEAHGAQIDTPWPLDVDQYEHVCGHCGNSSTHIDTS